MQTVEIIDGVVLSPRSVSAIKCVNAMQDAYLDASGDVLASHDDFTLSEMMRDIITTLYANEADVNYILAQAHSAGRNVYRE